MIKKLVNSKVSHTRSHLRLCLFLKFSRGFIKFGIKVSMISISIKDLFSKFERKIKKNIGFLFKNKIL
jgi:hypothetical protein